MSGHDAVARGLVWNTLAQLFQIGVSFAAMLVLVRLIPAEEYGRAATCAGVLSILGAFGSATFVSQALQLPAGEEPDWSAHWAASIRLQGAAFLVCNALALGARALPRYAPVAPLLHVASVGLLLEAPAQIAFAMQRRELAFRRMRIVMACATLLSTAVTLGVGLAGGGALAIVLGANLVGALPMTIELLVLRRFRPQGGWLRPLDLAAYRASLRFGAQRGGLSLLFALRNGLPGAVLPASIGYGALGILGRAQGLLTITAGRVLGVVLETIYPMLPQAAPDAAQYARLVALLGALLCWSLVPLLVFVAQHGPLLVAVVYGGRWAAVGPLLPAAAAAFFGQLLLVFGSTVLLGRNQVRRSTLAETLAAVGALGVLGLASFLGVSGYAWALGLAAIVTGVVAIAVARADLSRPLLGAAVLPPVVASLLGAAASGWVAAACIERPPLVRLLLVAAMFGLAVLCTLRIGFPRELARVVGRLPLGARLGRALRLEEVA